MKISELPFELKVFDVKLSNKDIFVISGDKLKTILKSSTDFVILKNGEGFNKNFIVNWTINSEETRKNVIEKKVKSLDEYGNGR